MTSPSFKARNIDKIKQLVLFRLFVVLICFSLTAMYVDMQGLILSAWLGGFFSYLAFHQLINVQITIIKTKSKSINLPLYLFRLCLYAMPMILYFYYENYLNLWIILVFLFSSQIIWIGTEIQLRLRKVRPKK